jgi:hypothetical protein
MKASPVTVADLNIWPSFKYRGFEENGFLQRECPQNGK